jgi:putative endonuclease
VRPGETAERRAARHYRLRGYRIVGRNVRVGGNELDLIVRRGRRLVFCEVKEKTGDGFGDPFEMVDAEKRRRIRHAAKAWLSVHPDASALDVAFEVVAVRGGRVARVADDLTAR